MVFKIDEDDRTRIIARYGLNAEFPMGILGLKYTYYSTGNQIDGKFSIEVTPFERKHNQKSKEWDTIRDTGWEYWLQILFNYGKEGQ